MVCFLRRHQIQYCKSIPFRVSIKVPNVVHYIDTCDIANAEVRGSISHIDTGVGTALKTGGEFEPAAATARFQGQQRCIEVWGG
jgi:hypothetical protein